MAVVSFADAAAHLGHKSRSTLYRLKREGQLVDYLRPGGKGGADQLELAPPDLPTLRQHLRTVLRLQHNSPTLRADQANRKKAQQLAAALDPAPATDSDPDRSGRLFWAEYGDWIDNAPSLPDAQFWEQVALLAGAMLGRPIDPKEAPELRLQLNEQAISVEAGARWNPVRWDQASARGLLEDLPLCAAGAAELRQLLARGRLSPELAEQARQALAQAPAAGGEGALSLAMGPGDRCLPHP